MKKFKRRNIYRGVVNQETGEFRKIEMDIWNSKDVKDYLIGGGIVVAGLVYLISSSFKNGAEAFDEAFMNTLKDLGLLSDNDDKK